MRQLWVQIYLPSFFNDGLRVGNELFVQTSDELIERFGGLSSQTSLISGIWRDAGQVYHDRLRCLYILADDTEDIRRFFRTYKSTLKDRFRQLEVLTLGYPVERF